jgi:hypothetical protein
LFTINVTIVFQNEIALKEPSHLVDATTADADTGTDNHTVTYIDVGI